MVIKDNIRPKWLPYLIPLFFSLIFVIFSYDKVWEGDAVEYGFVVPTDEASNTYTHIDSIQQIWDSQCTHYNVVNGRFVLHCIVQFYSGIAGKAWFAISNGIIFFIFILILSYLDGKHDNRANRLFICSILAFLLFFRVRFDDAFQIGYIWGGTFVLFFIYLFFNQRECRWWTIILLSIYSFIAGFTNEALTMGLSVGIIAYWIKKRCRFEPYQWVMAICFGIGALIEVLAPGNRIRVDDFTSTPWYWAWLNIFRYTPLLLCLIVLAAYNIKKNNPIRWSDSGLGFTAIASLIATYILLIISGIIYANSCMGADLYALILIYLYYKDKHISKRLIIITTIICCVYVIARWNDQQIGNAKWTEIQRQYFSSPQEGIVVLPQPLYGYEYRKAEIFCKPYVWVARASDRSAAPLHIYPEGLETLDEKKDTNLIIPFGEESWILVQSKRNPVKFTLDKYFPAIGHGKRFSHKELSFTPKDLGYVKETDAWVALAYINTHNLLFRTEVNIENP